MTREDLYQHYRHYYTPRNSALVVVGDVDTDEALRRVEQRFGGIPSGAAPPRMALREPEQVGERRVSIRKVGTTAYLKIAHPAPAVSHSDFWPLLVLDAVLTGAKGLNLWTSFRTPAPQRSTRLYKALVETGLASAVSGAMVPTEDPFLHVVSATAREGQSLAEIEAVVARELERVAQHGVTPGELQKAKGQLRARLVFDNDSVTNIAHQLGFFHTIASLDTYFGLEASVAAVTLEDVARAAHDWLVPDRRTVGCFEPIRAAVEAGPACREPLESSVSPS
jgi:zinc protease